MKKESLLRKSNGTALLILALVLSACTSTVVPKTNTATRASYDRQDTVKPTSGVLDFWRNDKGEIIGRIVSDHFKERVNAVADVYGDQFQPALQKDEGFTAVTFEEKPAWGMDREHYTKALQMFQWKRDGRLPTSGFKKLLNKFTLRERSFYDATNPQPKAFYDWMEMVSAIACRRDFNIDGDEEYSIAYWRNGNTPRQAIKHWENDPWPNMGGRKLIARRR